MNDADSKKLEEAKKMSVAIYLELPEPVADDVASKVRWLIFKVKEQDREIEQLIGTLEDNEHFKNAVEKFCEEKQGQQNMTDKLEGFSTGWIAARAVLAEVKEQK